MAIYGIAGIAISNAYDKDANAIPNAYDIDGNVVYNAIPPLGIKIMSYNVGGWYTGSGGNVPSDEKDAYYALQTGMIENNDPDILCIQEYIANFSKDGTSALTMLESLFPYVQVKTNSTYFGRAICSKYPITNYTQRTYSSESNRYYDSCTITIDEQEYTVVTTHLGLTLANRELQIAELLDYLSTLDKFIVCGDFNTVDCLNASGEDYTAIIKPILDAGYHVANCYGDASTFLVTYSERPNTTSKDLVLDNVIVPNDIQIRSVYVDTTKMTDSINAKIDHMPIIVTI